HDGAGRRPDARAVAPAAGRRRRRSRRLARAAGGHGRAAVGAREHRHPRQVAARHGLMRTTKRASPTSEVERRALLRAYRENGDLHARDRLVEGFMPLVSSLARRYAGRGEQLEDLEQVASLGLMKAIERFDLDREVDLVTYIFPTVVGELKRHFRDRVWSVTVPRRLKELYQLLSRLLDELTAKNGRQPTIPELAEAAGVTEEEVVEALEAGRAYAARSLTAPGTRDESEVEPIDLLEFE